MSFGPTAQTSAAMTGLQSNAGKESAAGGNLLDLGTGNTQAGANFFQTLLHGNQANTTAMLQPDINRIRGAQQGTLQAVSTLMPRGGGRSAELFSLPFQGNQQIQGLFNQTRAAAPQALAQIGAGQTNAGANLFGLGNQANTNLGELGQRQQQLTNQMWQGLGGGLFNLGSLPMAGLGGTLGGAAIGKLGGLFGMGGGGMAPGFSQVAGAAPGIGMPIGMGMLPGA